MVKTPRLVREYRLRISRGHGPRTRFVTFNISIEITHTPIYVIFNVTMKLKT